jgi:peptide/nickel transport system substrate-binding protein
VEEIMNEQQLRGLIEEVREGKVTRRDFIATLLAFGVAAPIAGQLLMHAASRRRRRRPAYKGTKRGGGGALKVLWWQGATLLNPHFATGTKDQDGSRIFYEPLAGWDNDGNLIPVLAAEVPTPENGGVSKDGKTITWKLKKDVQWHDGKPFTSGRRRVQLGVRGRPGDRSGHHRHVQGHQSLGHRPLYGARRVREGVAVLGGSVRQHARADHPQASVRSVQRREVTRAPNNLKPVGTGPYKFVDFTPGDMVRGALNPNYHQPNRPFFDTIEMKGGGDAVSARVPCCRRRVRLRVEPAGRGRDPHAPRGRAGKGRVNIIPAGDIEHIQFNFTDPATEIDGERASIKTKHPILTDPAVREAISLLVDRRRSRNSSTAARASRPANFVNNPSRFRSKSNQFEFNVEKASQLLDKAGWKTGSDGIRAKEGGSSSSSTRPRSTSRARRRRPSSSRPPRKRGSTSSSRRDGVGVLFVGCRQSRHVHEVLLRHPDVHDDDEPARPRDLHEPVRFMGVLDQREQVAGSKHHALAQRRV